MNLPLALSIALDVARGMQHMHQRGVLHGDLKARGLLLHWPAAALACCCIGLLLHWPAAALACCCIGLLALAWPRPQLLRRRLHLPLAGVLLSDAPPALPPALPQPGNILLTSAPRKGLGARTGAVMAKVSDFGMSRTLAGPRSHRTTQTLGGRPRWRCGARQQAVGRVQPRAARRAPPPQLHHLPSPLCRRRRRRRLQAP